MRILRRIDEVRQFVSQAHQAGHRVGLVPTMGYLHAGHLSLIHRIRTHADSVIATIFVNPTQFGPGEDLDAYPRDEEGDLEKARAAGCDAVFLPTVDAMYPRGSETRIRPGPMANQLCGGRRPGHFEGVCTVVLKLFHLTRCDVACFGEKDFQQLAIIRRMVKDLDLSVDVLSGPIVREDDGLAMSSRNVYLDAPERAQAPILRRALLKAEALWSDGERDPNVLGQCVRTCLSEASLAKIDYIEVCDANSLHPWDGECAGVTVIAIAVFFGHTRLIDNCELGTESRTS